jgi:hypothetical protein
MLGMLNYHLSKKLKLIGKSKFNHLLITLTSYSKSRSPLRHGKSSKEQELQECGNPSNEKFLSGKKILVAEDNLVLRMVNVSSLSGLGAIVEYATNGQEALQLVCNGLSDKRNHGASNILPYDYILMDCEVTSMISFPFTFFMAFSSFKTNTVVSAIFNHFIFSFELKHMRFICLTDAYHGWL